MKIAIYAGSFDPLTNGHLDILERASKMFDKIIIAVAYNSEKNAFLPVETRVNLIVEAVAHLSNVEVDCYEGLTAEYAKKKNASILIRGLRNSVDFEYEVQLAQGNNALNDTLETISFFTKSEHSFISSSMVREILKNKGCIRNFVPENIYNYLITYDV